MYIILVTVETAREVFFPPIHMHLLRHFHEWRGKKIRRIGKDKRRRKASKETGGRGRGVE